MRVVVAVSVVVAVVEVAVVVAVVAVGVVPLAWVMLWGSWLVLRLALLLLLFPPFCVAGVLSGLLVVLDVS